MYQMAVIETGISLAPRAARVGSRGERGSGVLHSSIAVVAGVDLAFGVLHGCTGVRRPSHRARNLLFGFLALAHSGAIMTARAAFMVDIVDQFASAVDTNTVISALSFALLGWYVAAYTHVQPRVLLRTVTGAFAIVGFAGIVGPDLVLNVSGGRTRKPPGSQSGAYALRLLA
jgi:hypothetical protein